MFPRRPRDSRRLHALGLLLLMLCVGLRPIIAIAGELHELGHSDTAAALHHHDHAHPQPTPSDTDADPLHGLLHAAQCCAAASAVLPAAMTDTVVAVTDAPTIRDLRGPLHRDQEPPLRPPNAG
jgi:hypothetical protein